MGSTILGGVIVVVEASDELRFQRLLERNRGGDDFDREQFNHSDLIERAWIDPIYNIANHKIDNNSTYQDLEAATLNILRQILSIE